MSMEMNAEKMTTQAPRKYRLSVVMIVKNEAHNLAVSLPALAGWVDEIVILDSGSTDHSQALAEQHSARWRVNVNWQGFGKQRQLAQSYATGDWILALDADEEITETLKNSILAAIQQPPDNTVYGIKRLDYVFGHCIDNPYWGIKAHWRLYPKKFQFNDNLVHESVVLNGAQTQKLDGFLNHHTADTPHFWVQKRLDYAYDWGKNRQRLGKSVTFYKILLNPFWAFFKQYFIDGRFLQGRYGLVYSLLFSHYTFNKYAIAYDLANSRAEAAWQAGHAAVKALPPFDNDEKDDRQATLSLVMIVQNEEKQLADCLASAADLVDEIVIVDSGSSDQTEAIAKQYGAKWHVHTDWRGFGKQRQLAQSLATGDYILVLDADERLDADLRDSIATLLKQPVQNDTVFSLARINYFSGVPTHLNGWYRDWEDRLYARENFGYNDLDVHESVNTDGAKIERLSGLLHHYTNDDLYHYMDKRLCYSLAWAQEKHANGKKVSLAGLLARSAFSFVREYLIRGQFLAGKYGFIASVTLMGYTFTKCVFLWQFGQDDE